MTPYKSYISGFLLSLALTFLAYFLVVEKVIHTPGQLIAAVLSLAVLQLFVQLKFFLHLNFREDGKLNMVFFISTIAVVLIVVVGSLWIMSHLNYNMTPDTLIIQDEGMQMK